MFDRIQKIRVVHGNNNIIINGDVVADGDILSSLALQLMRTEMARLSQEARREMQTCVDEYVQKVLEQVSERKIQDKLVEFVQPGAQWTFYSALKGYAISETEEQREMMVDAMIEWLQGKWDSTEKSIIDTAIEELPKLTPSILSVLGLLQLRYQMVSVPIGVILNQYFTSLSPLAEQVAGINVLEMEYLRQEKLILQVSGWRKAASLEQVLLNNYDLFFRKPLAAGVYEDYCKRYPEAHEAVNDYSACLMWMDSLNGDVTSFCNTNSKQLKETLAERGQKYIIPHVEALMEMMPVFTEEEVRTYFITISPAWERVFKLFSSEILVNNTLSITGNYIGGKILAKACQGASLPLSSYNIIGL